MSNQVYANAMEISCKAASGKSICSFPDVCFTPPQTPATPPGVPIPYPNTGMASDCTDGSSSVTISGKEVMLKNKSYFKKSTGDEAGAAPKKGLITSTNRGKIYFAAWSMDVKVEGQNVVRHLDMTTHNHGSAANQPAPWPYADAAAQAPGGACNQAPPKDYVEQVKANCADMQSPQCCATPGRKCMLLPYNKAKKGCCTKNGKPQTGHHLVDSAEFVAHAARNKTAPAGQYNSKTAPSICAEGIDHNRREGAPAAQPRRLMEHGRMGRAYARLRRTFLRNNATLTVGDACKLGAKSGRVVHPECSEECLAAQLEKGHADMGQPPGNTVPLQNRRKPAEPELFKVK
jgi:hypothetical protein